MNDSRVPHPVAAECDRLIALAEAMPAVAERRRTLAGAWYSELFDLTQAHALETPDGERALDALLLRLRRAWMSTAHEHADFTYRSPPADERKLLPSRTTVAYAYERSLETTPLDVRLPAYRPVPPGWHARHLLFSSGMAALAGIMQALRPIVGANATQRPHLLAAAAYYETRELLALDTHGCSSRVVDDEAAFAAACVEERPDIAFVEPIIYDAWLRPFDVGAAASLLAGTATPPVLVIDSTLVGDTLRLESMLQAEPHLPLVVQASSGLKLDQLGLELANVGVLSLYAPADRLADLDAAAATLRTVRRLNGTALTIDTVALLDVPFFLDSATFAEYSAAIFGHNANLARSVPAGALFARVAHPSLDARGLPWAQAPFVFFHLRDDAAARYQELERLVLAVAAQRGLALERGGSFGFRGHRCEAIALEDATVAGVFKVALGARAGPSLDGIVALLRDVAAFPTLAAAAGGLLPASSVA